MSTIFSRSNSSPSASSPEPLKTLPGVSKALNTVIDVCLHGAVFLVPLFFSSLTIDVLELNKQTILIILAGIAGIAWLGKALADKQFTLVRNWIHLVAVLFGVGYLLVSLLSGDRYLSMVGTLGQMPWAFSTVAALVVFYVVAVHRIRQTAQVYDFVFSFLVSSLIAGVYGLLQMFGIFLIPVAATQTTTFTSVGSVFSFAVYMTIPLLISASLAFHGCRNNVCLLGSSKSSGKIARGLLWATMIVSLLALILVDYWVAWAALLFGTLATVVIGYLRTREVGAPSKLAIPGVLVAVSILLLVFRTPVALNLPSEVSPSAMATMDIAKVTLRDMPVFGSGPGTWIYDYAKYRVQMVNLSPFWNVRFDRGFSFFLTLLATTGIVGAALWLILIISAIVKSAGHLMTERNDDVWYAYLIVFTGWLTLVFISFFYNFNMAHLFALWFLFSLLGALVGRNTITWDARKSAYAYGVISVVFVVALIGGISVTWLTGQRFVADAAFTGAVSDFRSGAPIDSIIAKIQKASSLNPMLDMYKRNLSQAHLIKAANLIQAGATPEMVPAIQNEIKLAVDMGLSATQLAPANVDNWSNLGLIYQSVASFTRGADEFAIKNYEEASLREPQNPVFLNEIGKLYLLRSDAYRTQLTTGDAAAKAETQKNVNDNLALGEQKLKAAIVAKPDYLPARYHLGIVYERQGRVKDAITELENVLRINNKDLGVAFELSILYYRNNQKNESLELMKQVSAIEPSNVNARWYLSAMLEERGEYQEALNQIKPLSTQYPDNSAIQQRMNSLTAAVNARLRPTTRALPEPIREEVRSQTDNTPVRQ
ncbi:tetratricopeptide repeat protein [Candidatus Uhrbacteria bacterium]|nr:tetratricopeptide repeat protein [Candidatus Uhrbacteria bacterium]